MFTSYQQEQELVDWLLKANMVFLMHYSRHLRSLIKKYCMKHIQTSDQAPIPSAEDAALQRHTRSFSITHPGFHHIVQPQCCLHLKYFVAGHYKQAPEVWVHHISVIFWMLVAISETATIQTGNSAFQVAKRHPGVLSFSILPALISLLHKCFAHRKIYRSPYLCFTAQPLH